MGASDSLDNVVQRYTRRRRANAVTTDESLDRFHQFYVGCTRAEDLLILTANRENRPPAVFDHVWAEIPRWTFMDPSSLAGRKFGGYAGRGATTVGRSITIDRLEHLVLRPRRFA